MLLRHDPTTLRSAGGLVELVLLAIALASPADGDTWSTRSATRTESGRTTRSTSLTVEGALRAADTTRPSADGRCPDGREPVGDFGVTGLEFAGTMSSIDDETWNISFRSEPRVRGVDERGPAAGRLRRGDVIVSIDGKLITTSAAGRIWSSPPIGRPVDVVVRREGRERSVTIVPVAACREAGTSWPFAAPEAPPVPPVPEVPPVPDTPGVPRASAAPPAPPATPRPGAISVPRAPRAERALRAEEAALREYERQVARAWVDDDTDVYTGLGLSADRIVVRESVDGEGEVVVFETAPEVFSVDEDSPAERAGLERGDVLLTVDEVEIATPEGSERIAELEPGKAVELAVRRGGGRVVLKLVPEERRVVVRRAPGAQSGPSVYRLRFAGRVGDAQVEVHGRDAARVGIEERPDEIVIETEEATISVRVERDR